LIDGGNTTWRKGEVKRMGFDDTTNAGLVDEDQD
jgi:hypothetical protein